MIIEFECDKLLFDFGNQNVRFHVMKGTGITHGMKLSIAFSHILYDNVGFVMPVSISVLDDLNCMYNGMMSHVTNMQ